ncbi:hypothetical protein RhiirA4_453179 [Rhizophagus irregularis]|uniref:Uncharacterized protein n=1 Tax=Rhizophagus irregularis TaxID=588596 RepID=A0A2I1FZT9_9GLOM|nr:hypothetical protein RhiirA4_453179 [Rhizophagus irregularis]
MSSSSQNFSQTNKGKEKQQDVQEPMRKLNERVSNLEINYINQAESSNNRKVELSFGNEDNTFMNSNNK